MRFWAWCASYLVVLILEVSFLPRFFGTALPMLAPAVLVLGITALEFSAGFWFAGFVGLIHDLLLPGGVPAIAPSLSAFFLMHGFLRFFEWHQPWNQIGAVVSGILALPLLQVAGSWASGQPLTSLLGHEFVGTFFFREASFSAAWFLVFAWVMIRRAERTRRHTLTRL